ncbi:maleylpyruvate isomerase family mycothiol-dependent enzyme [Streptacidiphilus sp. PB12-B1b]|uniref:maleylpyruvate isomerase family mycothiol-dependent enzyme n=1 Tax=Streptacidiphilus sp. PB12-B1b TaxID=2705012 RepID=UPI0015F89C70|nr:maleylpyruvate isomerase family mycothiol-dependent enzyme [Streptacidiphilus sp. PB12-B1b]QMU76819.1 maleylpyruvate isomerase family mycothiol-dependent enzyme [Streptacidiphilus sp. PB12-B1b]
MSTPSPVDYPAAVAAQTARFVDAVAGADLAAAVPSCPGWTLADLVKHAGSVQRWFSVLLRQRIQERPTSRDVDLDLPEREADYPGWLAASAAVAAEAFTAAGDLDGPMWAWGADQHARFWVRRMLFETVLHRVDAESALGLRPDVDGDLAADGVDEFLTNLPFAAFFAPDTANLRSSDGDRTIRFSCADTDRDWLVRLRADGFGPVPEATAAADATVRGSAQDLLLLVYGRLDLASGGIEAVGDEKLLAHWFANSAF